MTKCYCDGHGHDSFLGGVSPTLVATMEYIVNMHSWKQIRQGEVITDGETEPRTEKLEMAELSFGLACLGLSSEFETSTGARGDDHHEQPTPKLDGVAS